MKIYLSYNTAGRYGGGLNGNLRYFYRIIQSALDNANFKSSYDELWLTLSYPPMYVLPGVVGIEIDFKKGYDMLPYSRMDRKYRKIDVNLKAPEFSEHLDKKEQENYEHKFNIEDKYKNLSDTEFAKILIDKYIEAATIINSKIKKDDIFEFELFKASLIALKSKINPDYLVSENSRVTTEIKADTIKNAVALREERKQTEKVKDKKIRDLRVYYSGLPTKAFYPYDYQYVEIFLNLLRKKELMCPSYHHLYIQVGKTIEECLINAFAYDHWHIYGISVIDYDGYLNQTEIEKQQTVFNTIVNGLNDIAHIDKLDPSIIDETIKEIKHKGLDTELEYAIIENKKHKLTISYLSKSMEEQCPIYFTLLEKSSGNNNRVQIGRADNHQIHFWLQKVTITATQIKVKSSDSIAADVYLKGKPRSMEFNIKDLLNE
ncbi:MAG: hypothetical protein ABIN13_00350 [Mucilaginibacter sp.]